MSLFANQYRVESIRLKNRNYSQGWYFVTICVKDMEECFGEIIVQTQNFASVRLSRLGSIAVDCWRSIPLHFPSAKLDKFIVMPNHLHGIIKIVETQNFASVQARRANKFGPQSKNLASVIRGFKIGVKKWAIMNNYNFQWQARFYESVIKDRDNLLRVRKYIEDNPKRWLENKNK